MKRNERRSCNNAPDWSPSAFVCTRGDIIKQEQEREKVYNGTKSTRIHYGTEKMEVHLCVCMCVKCTHVRYLKFFTCLLFSDRLYGCKRDEEEREKYAIEAVLETGLHLAWTVRAWGRQYQRM